MVISVWVEIDFISIAAEWVFFFLSLHVFSEYRMHAEFE